MYIVSFQRDAHAHAQQWSTIISKYTCSQIAYMNQINLIFLLEQFMSKKRSFQIKFNFSLRAIYEQEKIFSCS